MSNELHGWKGGKKQTHKKREIRVFVSSTFRDFTLEREAIIKKAFREVSEKRLKDIIHRSTKQ